MTQNTKLIIAKELYKQLQQQHHTLTQHNSQVLYTLGIYPQLGIPEIEIQIKEKTAITITFLNDKITLTGISEKAPPYQISTYKNTYDYNDPTTIDQITKIINNAIT